MHSLFLSHRNIRFPCKPTSEGFPAFCGKKNGRGQEATGFLACNRSNVRYNEKKRLTLLKNGRSSLPFAATCRYPQAWHCPPTEILVKNKRKFVRGLKSGGQCHPTWCRGGVAASRCFQTTHGWERLLLPLRSHSGSSWLQRTHVDRLQIVFSSWPRHDITASWLYWYMLLLFAYLRLQKQFVFVVLP